MSQPYSTRDDLKRDAFQEKFQAALEWIAANRQTFFSVVGTLAVGGVIAAFVVTNFRTVKRQGWERYNMGQTWAATNNPQNAINEFDYVITNYGRTPAAVYSLLGKGDVLYQQKKYPEAVAAYKAGLAKNPPRIIQPFLLSGLGAAQEDMADFPGAIETYKQFTANFPDHILAPKIYESLGRVYEFSRNQEAAKEVYEKIITMFPDTLWSQKARDRYQALAPLPFQNAGPEPPGAPPARR